MRHTITVSPLPRWARTLDTLMIPLMYLLAGTFKDAPQQTHRWNNKKLALEEVTWLDPEHVVHHPGIPDEKAPWLFRYLPLFHIPIFGGWKQYLVISPTSTREWRIGWITDHVCGVTRLSLKGPVRVLLGPSPVQFFGMDMDGRQITVREIGRGRVGQPSEYRKVPLL